MSKSIFLGFLSKSRECQVQFNVVYNCEMQIILSPEHEVGIQENWSSTGKLEQLMNYKTHGVQREYQSANVTGWRVKPISSRFQPWGTFVQSQGIRQRIIVPSFFLSAESLSNVTRESTARMKFIF